MSKTKQPAEAIPEVGIVVRSVRLRLKDEPTKDYYQFMFPKDVGFQPAGVIIEKVPHQNNRVLLSFIKPTGKSAGKQIDDIVKGIKKGTYNPQLAKEGLPHEQNRPK